MLWAIDKGPLREDPDELAEFINDYVAELNPGRSPILQRAALDLADKAWRVVRAQRWEAQGFSAADYQTREAAGAAWMRFNAGRYRGYAKAVRRFPDSDVSDDDLAGALCILGFAVRRAEEDQEWVEDADRAAVVEALADLISEHFGDQEEAAVVLDERADSEEAQAREVEELWRPHIIRREMDGSFARNAERLVSHASREFDRALRRYDMLAERFGDTDEDHGRDDGDSEPGEDGVAPHDDGIQPEPDGGAGGAADKLGIWSYMTADEVVEYLSNPPLPAHPTRRRETNQRTGAQPCSSEVFQQHRPPATNRQFSVGWWCRALTDTGCPERSTNRWIAFHAITMMQ